MFLGILLSVLKVSIHSINRKISNLTNLFKVFTKINEHKTITIYTIIYVL